MGALVVMIGACADEALGPVVTFEKATIGAYVRFVSQEGNAEFDLANPSASSFAYAVDFVSLDNGARVSEYVVEAVFSDGSPANGDQSKPATIFKSFTSADFSPSPKGNPGVSVTVSFTDMLTLFGLTQDELRAGDAFSLFGIVKTDDGGEYRSTNTTSTVRGSAFQGFFDIGVNVTCPLPSSIFVGDYAVAFEGDAGTDYGVPFDEGIVTLSTVAGSSTKRTFEVTYLPGIGGFGPYPVNFDILCDQSIFLSMIADGLGCGQGSLTMGPVLDDNKRAIGVALDIADDSTFKLFFNEGTNTAGCSGVSETMTTAVFTKQ